MRAKLILAPLGMRNEFDHQEPIDVLHSNLHMTSKHAPKTYGTWKVLYAKQPTPAQKSHVELRG